MIKVKNDNFYHNGHESRLYLEKYDKQINRIFKNDLVLDSFLVTEKLSHKRHGTSEVNFRDIFFNCHIFKGPLRTLPSFIT